MIETHVRRLRDDTGTFGSDGVLHRQDEKPIETSNADWPRFKSRRVVRAKQITQIHVDQKGPPLLFIEGEGVFRPTEPGMANRVSAGDYAIIYDDGYSSVCPKESFEKNYTLETE